MKLEEKEIFLVAAEVSELRISHGEIGFVLTCPADLQVGLETLMEIAGSDEFTFTVKITPDTIPEEAEDGKN